MVNGINYVTLVTDASTDNKSGCGLAYYIVSNDGVDRHAWYLPGKYDSTDAEWLALQAALDVMYQREYDTNTKLVYYCDNTTMIDIIKGKLDTKRFTRNWGNKVMWVRPMLNKFESVDARHVKGHVNPSKFTESKYLMNRWCDMNARSMLRHQRLHIEHR